MIFNAKQKKYDEKENQKHNKIINGDKHKLPHLIEQSEKCTQNP